MKDYQRDNSNKHDVLCKNKHPPPNPFRVKTKAEEGDDQAQHQDTL